MDLSKFIRDRRVSQGIQQSKLGQAAGVGQTFISRVEGNGNALRNFQRVANLFSALGLTVSVIDPSGDTVWSTGGRVGQLQEIAHE